MYTFFVCGAYTPIAYAAYDTPLRDVVARCAELEQERNDGYAVIAVQDGRIVADAEGARADHDDNRTYRAQLDHACGYVD